MKALKRLVSLGFGCCFITSIGITVFNKAYFNKVNLIQALKSFERTVTFL